MSSPRPMVTNASMAANHGLFGVLHPKRSTDGQVTNPYPRNAVPGKLKGKTDPSKGNFMIMQTIPSAGIVRSVHSGWQRELSARRHAKQKQSQPDFTRLRQPQLEDSHAPEGGPLQSPLPTGKGIGTQSSRATKLTPLETKSEQARLLTLLRSLHPTEVVDRLCAAVTLFGGIPGTPPPVNHAFPESCQANGPGSVLIGWIAEIFPDNQHREDMIYRQKPSVGISGPAMTGLGEDLSSGRNQQDSSQSPGVQVGAISTGAGWTSASATRHLDTLHTERLPQNCESDAHSADVSSHEQVASVDLDSPKIVPSQGTLSRHVVVASPDTDNAPRKRGRPKGSRNKPKDTRARANPVTPDDCSNNTPTALRRTGSISEIARKPGRGRPKGSKNKPKVAGAPMLSATSEVGGNSAHQAAGVLCHYGPSAAVGLIPEQGPSSRDVLTSGYKRKHMAVDDSE